MAPVSKKYFLNGFGYCECWRLWPGRSWLFQSVIFVSLNEAHSKVFRVVLILAQIEYLPLLDLISGYFVYVQLMSLVFVGAHLLCCNQASVVGRETVPECVYALLSEAGIAAVRFQYGLLISSAHLVQGVVSNAHKQWFNWTTIIAFIDHLEWLWKWSWYHF